MHLDMTKIRQLKFNRPIAGGTRVYIVNILGDQTKALREHQYIII